MTIPKLMLPALPFKYSVNSARVQRPAKVMKLTSVFSRPAILKLKALGYRVYVIYHINLDDGIAKLKKAFD